jgi:hypothetical protein
VHDAAMTTAAELLQRGDWADDRCQRPRWGVVLKGKLVYHYADGDDVIEGGQAYYAKPGHTPEIFAGTEVVEFHATDELAKTMEVVERNLAAMG